MPIPVDLAELRLRLRLRLAVAPKALFKTLWSPQSRPHERDAALDVLVASITQGWDAMDLRGEIQPGRGHSVPPTHEAG